MFDCVGFGLLTHDRLIKVDEFPVPNRKMYGYEWHEQLGGPAAVGLLTMSSLGLKSAWGIPLSAYKENPDFFEKYTTGAGLKAVNDSSIRKKVPLPNAVIIIDRKTGERTVILEQPLILPVLSKSHLKKVTGNTRWIYTDGRDFELTLNLKSESLRNDTGLFLDIGSKRPEWEKIVKDVRAVIVSDDMMSQVDSNLEPKEFLRYLAGMGVKIAGITLGGEGSIFLHEGQYYSVPAHKNSWVKDMTNAGDVFHGAFLAALIRTGNVRKSANFASGMASWVTGQYGHNLERLPSRFKKSMNKYNGLEKSVNN
ncbi:MAG: carbohydrate kinase family protein [Calditrichaceae bacterium]